MFRGFATRGRVSGRDILKVALSQNLVDILFLVYVYVSGLLLHVHAQMPLAGALAFISHSKGFSDLSLKREDGL
jgi:hypothetical protein